MKKLIAIALVLAMAPIVSAGLYIDAPTQVDEGATFTVNLKATEGANAFVLGALTVDGATVKADSFSINATFTALADAGTVKDGSIEDIVAFQVKGNAAPGIYVAAGEVIWSVQLTAGAAGSVITIDDFIGTNPTGGAPFPVSTSLNGIADNLATATVNVVPEPMTMALMGLGGLFLRRRRA